MRVQYAAAALLELQSIGAYIVERNPQAALRVERERAAHSLATMPRRGRKQRSRGVWKIGVGKYPYNIYYRIDGVAQIVTIVTIRHAARQPRHRNT